MPTRSRPLLIALAAVVAAPGLASAQAPLSAHDVLLLNRVTWGVTPADVADMQKLGPKRWLDRQLHPSSDEGLPPQVQAEIDGLTTSREPLSQLIAEAEATRAGLAKTTDTEQRQQMVRAFKQYLSDREVDAETRSMLRDIYSKNQLQTQMTWFWLNHFNVYLRKADIRAMLADYEETAIRPHALGRFRDLLEATLRHPAMLRYLDNAQNAAGHLNENYAREIMELHTMGVGSGYTQKDVQELARILTGVGVDARPVDPKLPPRLQALYIRQGDFEFNPRRHDFGDKVFLGNKIKGSGFPEVEQALDILCREPATAHHISLELATYFVGDNPPPALVARMAKTFQRRDGDIAQVLKTMFDSPEFDRSLGTQFKDPMHYVISAVRLSYGDRTVVNVTPIEGWLHRLSEGLYDHETPDGYPMTSAAWNGPGQMAARFEIARAIALGPPALFTPYGQPPSGGPDRPRLQARVEQVSLERGLGAPTRAALGEAASPQEWTALFLSSPEFMRR